MKNNHEEDVLTLSNPRLLSAVYFSLLAIIVTIFIDTVIYALGTNQLVPVFQGILLAVIVAAVFGALFGKAIIHSQKPYGKKVFWLAFLMVLIALPVYDLGFLFLFQHHHGAALGSVSFKQSLYLYLLILFYSFILVGLWLAILSGVAALFLRGKLVNYLVRQTRYERRKSPKGDVVQSKTPKYGQATVTMPEDEDKKS
mgnify:CR=1 FL=1